ncbi:MAG: hypothetical protein Q4A34_03030 [Candidatus Saccharibacteria bacterium]|nr:hypothetical protein [Candidatus Saccharibacteria bacterium]
MPRRNYRNQPKAIGRLSRQPLPSVQQLHQCRQKRRFTSERAAMEALMLRELQLRSEPLRVYHCPWCRGWHLTRSDS